VLVALAVRFGWSSDNSILYHISYYTLPPSKERKRKIDEVKRQDKTKQTHAANIAHLRQYKQGGHASTNPL